MLLISRFRLRTEMRKRDIFLLLISHSRVSTQRRKCDINSKNYRIFAFHCEGETAIKRNHKVLLRKYDVKNIAFSRDQYLVFAFSPFTLKCENKILVVKISRFRISVRRRERENAIFFTINIAFVYERRKCENAKTRYWQRDVFFFFFIVFSRQYIVFSRSRPEGDKAKSRCP